MQEINILITNQIFTAEFQDLVLKTMKEHLAIYNVKDKAKIIASKTIAEKHLGTIFKEDIWPKYSKSIICFLNVLVQKRILHHTGRMGKFSGYYLYGYPRLESEKTKVAEIVFTSKQKEHLLRQMQEFCTPKSGGVLCDFIVERGFSSLDFSRLQIEKFKKTFKEKLIGGEFPGFKLKSPDSNVIESEA